MENFSESFNWRVHCATNRTPNSVPNVAHPAVTEASTLVLGGDGGGGGGCFPILPQALAHINTSDS